MAGGLEHRLEPRGASLVDGEGGALDRNPRTDGHLPGAVRAASRLAGVAEDDGVDPLGRELQQQLFESGDAKEGLAAYVEKRKAEFTGR